MRLDAIEIGVNPPDDVNVVIEVPIGGEPIKYEMDKAAGTFVVDRFLHTPMRYPALDQIQHFFEHYKDLEPGKWVKLIGWGDVEEARGC